MRNKREQKAKFNKEPKENEKNTIHNRKLGK
jgi:hypothetical protein